MSSDDRVCTPVRRIFGLKRRGLIIFGKSPRPPRCVGAQFRNLSVSDKKCGGAHIKRRKNYDNRFGARCVLQQSFPRAPEERSNGQTEQKTVNILWGEKSWSRESHSSFLINHGYWGTWGYVPTPPNVQTFCILRSETFTPCWGVFHFAGKTWHCSEADFGAQWTPQQLSGVSECNSKVF